MSIVVIGSANMDMSIWTNRIPEIGETIKGHKFLLSAGGKGANQAVACAKMGADTKLIAKVGDDLFGQTMIGNLGGFGVRTELIGVERNATTGVAAITVCEGNNSIILDGGANDRMSPSDITRYREELLAASAILLQLEIPLETVYEAIRLAKGKVPIFLNPAPAIPLDESVLRGVDYFTPNEIECRVYAGIDIRTKEDAFAALDVLLDKGIRYPLITLGEKGIVYYNGQEKVYKQGHPVEAIDTTAAGDTFSGTFATMIASGKTMDEAVDIAQLAASISVTRPGAQNAIPYLAELTS